jgi:hypothetical protein
MRKEESAEDDTDACKQHSRLSLAGIADTAQIELPPGKDFNKDLKDLQHKYKSKTISQSRKMKSPIL